MEFHGFTLDPFQEKAVNSINNDHSVIVSAATGSGKTLIADYIIEKYLEEGKRVVYTSPIKALSNQKYRDFKEQYGEESIGLITGDIVINSSAPILIMTTEVYRNLVLVHDRITENISYVIFDEIHFINDIERGYVWEESIIFSPTNVRMLCLSATIPNADEFADWIRSIKKHKVDVIKHLKRNVPLHQMFYEQQLGICTLEDIREIKKIPVMRTKGRKKPKIPKADHVNLIEILGQDKMPILFFCFSRHMCQKNAEELLKRKQFPSDSSVSEFVSQKLRQHPYEIGQLESTRLLRQLLPKGIAFHHAGLLPVQKEIVEELFGQGKIRVLYATETFAVGINMPAKSVCFEGLRKFNGITFSFLTSKEYFQMAGRAGRRGIDKEGFVCPMIDIRDFQYGPIKKITDADMEPLKSQFRLSVNAVLNLVKDHTDREIEVILDQSLFSYQNKSKKQIIKRNFKNILRKLKKLHYVQENRELTEKGHFASRLFCDEIIFTEIFGTEKWKDLDSYEITLIIAAMVYEPRLRTKFFNQQRTKTIDKLRQKVGKIMKDKTDYFFDMSSLVYPLFTDADFFDIINNTNLDEGDIIRFYSQIMDRINQLQRANEDPDLNNRLQGCFGQVKDLLSELM